MNPRLHIAHVGPLPRGNQVGGVGRYLADISQAVSPPQFTSVVLAQRDADASLPGVRVIPAWSPGPLAFREVSRALPRGRGILHVQYETALFGSVVASITLPGYLAAWRRAGWRTVVTMHHVIPKTFGVDELRLWKTASAADPLALAALRLLQGQIARAADAVIVHEARQVGDVGGKPRVIPLYVPFRSGPLKRSRDQDATCTRLAFFGFLAEYKGVLELARAVDRAARSGARVHLDIVGGEHPRLAEAPAYRRFVDAIRSIAGTSDSVTMHGYLEEDEADRVLRAADAVVLPYRAALAGSAALTRAVGLGIPVIVSTKLAEVLELPRGVPVIDPADPMLHRRIAEFDPTALAHTVEYWKSYKSERSLARVAATTVELYSELMARGG